MDQIPVFAAEREAGLEQLITSTARVCYASACELSDPFAISRKAEKLLRSTAGSRGQIDLHYLKAVLVTAGVWNRNDDVFDPREVWAARATPEHKPFNYQHECDDIIGHITGSYAIDDAGSALADDLADADLPDKFHVVTPAVKSPSANVSAAVLEDRNSSPFEV